MDVQAQAKTSKITPHQILKDYYGYSHFRAQQETIIHDLIHGKDLLVLMPTGGGKSLCYQIPALLRYGTGIVVSPLIALMEDQVTALKLQGIKAAYYNSSLSSQEAREVLANLHQEKLELLYVAPERLLSEGFLNRLKECPIALFAIDEAHCISQWGHDFRKEYAGLNALKRHFPEIPIIALTATADAETQKDIVRQLNYHPKQYVASFNRPNIHYQVILKEDPLKQIQQFLQSKKGQSGIIYCTTRKEVEKLTLKLQGLGFATRAYHAGLAHEERREVQRLFRMDHIDLVVATIAFGMGIDKPNVRFVIHHDLPKNIESYYQETGRAGRDGLPAQALLLYNPGDSAKLRAFINAITDENQQRLEHHKLNHMLRFAEATVCRRQVLLKYFDEEYATACAFCDVCDNPPTVEDVTEDVQKILSCIYRLHQNYGLIHVIDVLRGSLSAKVTQFNHQTLSTFGIGKEKSIFYWKSLAWQLIHRGYCTQDTQHYHVLRLTTKAIPVLRKEERVSLVIHSSHLSDNSTRKKKIKSEAQHAQNPLFETLRQIRRELANEENKPPFMIFSDMTLHEMARLKPQNEEQLLLISGVGQHKLKHYGQYFLKALVD